MGSPQLAAALQAITNEGGRGVEAAEDGVPQRGLSRLAGEIVDGDRATGGVRGFERPADRAEEGVVAEPGPDEVEPVDGAAADEALAVGGEVECPTGLDRTRPAAAADGHLPVAAPPVEARA